MKLKFSIILFIFTLLGFIVFHAYTPVLPSVKLSPVAKPAPVPTLTEEDHQAIVYATTEGDSITLQAALDSLQMDNPKIDLPVTYPELLSKLVQYHKLKKDEAQIILSNYQAGYSKVEVGKSKNGLYLATNPFLNPRPALTTYNPTNTDDPLPQ